MKNNHNSCSVHTMYIMKTIIKLNIYKYYIGKQIIIYYY